ncbi:MAG TPA: ornithine carbamoyltransferase [Albitalea sp.]
MSAPNALLVLAQARTLKREALAGRTQALLRGRNFGLVCEVDDGEDARLFRRAASELGAHVAHVRPVLSEQSSAQEVRHTAHLLGRLYDAVECQGLAPALVRRVADDAGVPVYDGIASASHPTAQLAEMLDGDSLADNRRFVLQAVLLSALG